MAEAKAGEMVLKIDGKRVRYQLKHREKRGEERIGFTCADVLYQLMPDRFASGMVENDQLITMNPYQCDRSNPNLRHGGDLENPSASGLLQRTGRNRPLVYPSWRTTHLTATVPAPTTAMRQLTTTA